MSGDCEDIIISEPDSDDVIIVEETPNIIITEDDDAGVLIVEDETSTIITEEVVDVLLVEIEAEAEIITDIGVGPQGIQGLPGPGGGGGVGTQEIYYQVDDPGATGTPYLWAQDLGGGAYTVWIDDGSGS